MTFDFCPFSIGHFVTWPSNFVLFQLAVVLSVLRFCFCFLSYCIICPPLINGFGLPLWCLQTFSQTFPHLSITVITKLPNSEQSYKGKVKTHKYINRQNQSTRKEYLIKGEMINVQLFSRKKSPVFISRNSKAIYMYLFILFLWTFSKVFPNSGIFEIVNTCMPFQSTEILNWYTLFSRSKCFYHIFTQDMLNFAYVIDSKCNKSYLQGV
jgi:hypothetical protein